MLEIRRRQDELMAPRYMALEDVQDGEDLRDNLWRGPFTHFMIDLERLGITPASRGHISHLEDPTR